MKLNYMLLLFAATAVAFTGCKQQEQNELAHHHEHGEHAESDDGEINLEPEMAAKFGVKVDTVALAPFGDVIKVSGTVLPASDGNAVVSAPTSGILTLARGVEPGASVSAGSTIASIRAEGVTGGDANRVAKVELDAARAEYERVSALWADKLVTKAQYESAKAGYERARASYSAPAASGRASAPISGVVTSLDVATGQYVETGTPIATIAASDRLVLRADVPARYASRLSAVTDARFEDPYTGEQMLVSSLDGRRLNAGSSTSGAMSGYIPVTFSLRNDGSLTPGVALTIYLIEPQTRSAISVPRAALVEQQGSYFVFTQLDEDCYNKIPVEIGASNGQRVEIVSGLKGGEHVVVAGTAAVRLAETSGNVPEGHSHSH